MIITCGSLVPYGSSRDITREHPLHINGPLILYVTERKRFKKNWNRFSKIIFGLYKYHNINRKQFSIISKYWEILFNKSNLEIENYMLKMVIR